MRQFDNTLEVLYVIETLNRGGAERALLNLVPTLIAQNIKPLVMPITGGGELQKEFEQSGAEIISLGYGHKWNLLKNISLLSSFIKARQPDIIHAHLFFAGLYTGLGKYWGIKQPKFITFHNLAYAPGCNPRNLSFHLRKLLNRHVVKHCMNRRIAVSSAVAKHYAQNLGIATECFDLIPNGLPIPESSSKPNQRIKEKIKIVALGRLVPEKGYEYLLKAFALINQKQPDRFQLQIIGGGPLDQELRALARSLQLEVLFFGSMAYEEAQIELANADIFVTASIFEGFGLSVAEAMLAEVPVVVTDIGGIRDIVRPDFAEIVLPRQPESIAQAILRVAELSQTEQDQRVKKARQFVEKNFSVKSVASRLANAYQKQLRELH